MSLNDTIPAPHTPLSLTVDAAAVSIIPLALLNVLPYVATALTIVWLCLNIYAWFINKRWIRRNNG